MYSTFFMKQLFLVNHSLMADDRSNIEGETQLFMHLFNQYLPLSLTYECNCHYTYLVIIITKTHHRHRYLLHELRVNC